MVTTSSTEPSTERSPGIDPRIRARRVAVRRFQGRRRLRRVGAVAVVAATLGGGVALSRSALLDVDRVTVAGAARTGTAAVTAAAAVEPGDALLGVDAAAVERRVESLPWVASATVSRSWPGTLRVTVAERTPVATVAAPGGWALVDGEGRVLAVEPEVPPGLPRLEGLAPGGPDGTAPVGPPGTALEGAGPALTVVQALPPDLGRLLRRVDVTGGGLRLELEPEEGGAPTTVELGSVRALEDKLLAIVAVLDEVDVADVARLDVRVPAAPVLTRHPPAA